MKKAAISLTILSLLAGGSVYANGHSDTWNPETSSVQSTIPSVNKAMFKPEFWVSKLKDGQKIIMNQEDIQTFNQQIRTQLPTIIFDLENQPTSWNKADLSAMLAPSFPDYPQFLNGNEVSPAYYQSLNQLMNLPGIQENNQVQYALTVKRTSIRTFPTNDFVVDSPTDQEFDNFQETAIDPAQPLLVLHTSSDGNWNYVRMYNYTGWIPANDIAITNDRTSWLKYSNNSKFLVVTDSIIRLGYNPWSPELSELEFEMGAKIPLASEDDHIPTVVDKQNAAGNYVVKLPVRGQNGQLNFKLALIPISKDVSEGYLPYSRENIIQQAFKVLGERYGWGGLFHGKDCSAYIKDVYLTFGIQLPRNTSQQVKIEGNKVTLANITSIKEREELIKTLQPGAAIYKKGHAVIYIGEYKGKQYALHDISEYGDTSQPNTDGTLKSIPLNEVVLTDLTIPLPSGKQLIELFNAGNQYELTKVKNNH
jgi:hypothetical protein